ncbi:MAG: hypothetical protein CL484_14455 [Acidobacteria bacterium]|jgi:hypothetical protein|uniref:DUF2274 domain-containing protein n=1 Tax=Halomonas sp. PA16-9 TaxID=2576841 RepID=UPI000C9370AA|nr:hypothetical protein [Acidobacteriota bacterium]|tara:strand:+ start:1405 stop:1749 length:345 start_codon:yes stop_codon:yes gene_type:complete
MLIGRVEHDPKKSLQAQLRESTLIRLEQYRELYQFTFDEKVSTSDLVDLMLNNLMDRDRSFKKFLREQAKQPKEEKQGADQNAATGAEEGAQGPVSGNGNPGQHSGPGQQPRQA